MEMSSDFDQRWVIKRLGKQVLEKIHLHLQRRGCLDDNNKVDRAFILAGKHAKDQKWSIYLVL